MNKNKILKYTITRSLFSIGILICEIPQTEMFIQMC